MDHSPSGARQTLPPIHTVLGDQLRLELPTAVSHSPHSSSSYASFYTCEEGAESSSEPSGSGGSIWLPRRSPARPRAFTIPLPPVFTALPATDINSQLFIPKTSSLPATPIPSSSPTNYHLDNRQDSVLSESTVRPESEGKGKSPQSTPSFSYSILRPSPSGELITAPQIKRGRRQKRNDANDNAQQVASGSSTTLQQRRHVCDICQKTFNRPSSLQTHSSVHTGSRPFECPHQTCTKVFSVASNMRRHFRKHHAHHSGTTPSAIGSVRQQQQQPQPQQNNFNRNVSRASSDGDGDGDGEDDDIQMDMGEGQSSSLSPIVLPRIGAEHHWNVPDA